MELEGTFHNGVIIPDDTSALTEGKRVRIEPVVESEPQPDKIVTFGEYFAEFKGCLKDAPEDLASQHDHYRLGTPKR